MKISKPMMIGIGVVVLGAILVGLYFANQRSSSTASALSSALQSTAKGTTGTRRIVGTRDDGSPVFSSDSAKG